MPPLLKINAVAFVSAQNFPILVRSFIGDNDDLKYHYLAHTSLDVIEERTASPKYTECYLGLLFSMEEVAVYGFMTPLKLKIIVALALTDTVVRDQDMLIVFKAFHAAYAKSIANPFLRLHSSPESSGLTDPSPSLLTEANADSRKQTAFKKRVDEVARTILGNE